MCTLLHNLYTFFIAVPHSLSVIPSLKERVIAAQTEKNVIKVHFFLSEGGLTGYNETDTVPYVFFFM